MVALTCDNYIALQNHSKGDCKRKVHMYGDSIKPQMKKIFGED